MTARQLKLSLELLDSQQPPFLVFRLTPARMNAGGVLIRVPNALDAAAAGQPQWNPGGLQIGPEYLDNAVVIEAVEDLMWRS